MDAKERLSDQLIVRVPPNLRRAIEAEAAKDRRAPSALVRNVIEDWLKSRPTSAQAA